MHRLLATVVVAMVWAFGGCADEELDASCRDRRQTLVADLDGDGADDIAWRAYEDGELFVGVCTATGIVDAEFTNPGPGAADASL